MKEQLIIYFVILFIGWFLVVFPSRFLLPHLVSKQLSYKDSKNKNILNNIAFYKFEDKAEAIENLMKNSQNIEFMRENYPVTFKWYSTSHRIWRYVMMIVVTLTILGGVINLVKFSIDPSGEFKRLRNASEAWEKSK